MTLGSDAMTPCFQHQSIHDYISEFDSVANANHVLDELMDVMARLTKSPERGSYPKELVSLGIKVYRQAFFKPHRVIYRITGTQVIIYPIAHGRRDMHSVLARRLLGAQSCCRCELSGNNTQSELAHVTAPNRTSMAGVRTACSSTSVCVSTASPWQ